MPKAKPAAEPSQEAQHAVVANSEQMDPATIAHYPPMIGRHQKSLPKLRELGQARMILDGWLAETEGEETPELADLFAKLEGETREKVERWGLYLIDRDATEALMLAEANFYLAEGARLKERALAFGKDSERSRKQLQFQMELQNIDEVKGVYCTVRLQRNPPKCVGDVDAETLQGWYLDEQLQQFVRYTPESFALDRAAVTKAAINKVIERVPGDGRLAIIAEQRVVIK